MFQIKIIDSYQLQTYERVMDCVNEFCGSHDVVEVKSDVKKDDIIYSIVYRISPKAEEPAPQADNKQSTPCSHESCTQVTAWKCDKCGCLLSRVS